MINNLKLYYSIDNLISDDNIFNLLKTHSCDSLKEYKAELWSNDINYGTIVFILEIKYDESMNYYTKGMIKILLKDNIFIESTFDYDGCKLDFLTNTFNIISNKYMININIDFVIYDNNSYGTLEIKSL